MSTPPGRPTTTQALRSLLDHAAARLAEEDGLKHLHENVYTTAMSSSTRATYSQHVSSATAAMAYAEATLRLAAACLTEESTDATADPADRPASRRTGAGRAGRTVREPATGSLGT